MCVGGGGGGGGGGEGGQCILKGDSVYQDGMSGGDTVSGGTGYPVTSGLDHPGEGVCKARSALIERVETRPYAPKY